MNNSKDLAIEVEGLSVSFGMAEIVKGVSLRVARGEFVAIVGKSGCGKTTFLKAIAGLVNSSGSLDRRGRIRMVFQEGLLLPWLSVEKNILLGAVEEETLKDSVNNLTVSSLSSKSGSSSEENLQSLLLEMGIEHLRHSYPYEISGGERQRVAIARAFAAKPDIVLMDEPFGALDIFTRERMQTWLLSFWERHRVAILFVTHDIEEGLILGDRLTVMAEGKFEPDHIIHFPRPRNADIKYTENFLEARIAIRKQIIGKMK